MGFPITYRLPSENEETQYTIRTGIKLLNNTHLQTKLIGRSNLERKAKRYWESRKKAGVENISFFDYTFMNKGVRVTIINFAKPEEDYEQE